LVIGNSLFGLGQAADTSQIFRVNGAPLARELYVSGTWDMRLSDSVALAHPIRERARMSDAAAREFARMVEEYFPRAVRFCTRLQIVCVTLRILSMMSPSSS
jgi:hypothetical protein